MIGTSLDKHRDAGLLILRVGVGLAFLVLQGLRKFQAGEETLITVGSAMGHIGITSGYYWWGVAAATAESAGATLLALGFFFRPATLAMLFVMIMAAIDQSTRPMPVIVHPLVNASMFAGLFLIGPGRYSLDAIFGGRRYT